MVKVSTQGSVEALEKAALEIVKKHTPAFKKKAHASKFRHEMEKVCKNAFAIIRQRVVVNGNPWNPNLKDEGLEPNSRSLRDQLQKIQAAVYDAAERVAQHRRAGASTVESAMSEQLSAAVSVEKLSYPPLEAEDVPALSDETVKSLERAANQIHELSQSVPALVARCEQLASVAADQERLRHHPTEAAITDSH